MQGILLLDKPKGWTSFDAVGYVRKTVAQAETIRTKSLKVGHIGTLDPLATGLLVLLVGKEYTKRAMDMTKLDKVYEVELKLGEVSDSFDDETDKHPFSDLVPSKEQVDKLLDSLVGKSLQTPPIYSAIKVNGKRAYKSARQGEEIELKARPVEIYSLDHVVYDYPILKFIAHVSSGTYIRSLAQDIGIKLGSGAYMSGLNRLKIGDFSLSDSISLEGLTAEQIKASLVA